MTRLRRSLDDYLALRRSLGYKLESVAPALAGFVAFAEDSGADTVTVALAVAWAKLPATTSRIWVAHRLSMVRGFARYLQTIDAATEIPPADLLPAGHYRPAAPYLYSDADVVALMAAARTLSPPLRAATLETLIGLLAATGLRIGEALRLNRGDVDWTHRLLVVRDSKHGRSRQVPCHPTTIEALRAYDTRRVRLCPAPSSSPSLFVSTRGTRLRHSSVYPAFHRLLRQAGLDDTQGSSPRRPRVHDLRHSFAVDTQRRWYRDGDDVEVRMPLLSTYLGHVKPANTYWYLSAAPELMTLAAQRLEQTQEVRP